MIRRMMMLCLLVTAVGVHARSQQTMRWVNGKGLFDLVIRFNYQSGRDQAFWQDYFEEVSKELYNSTEGQMQLGTVKAYMNDQTVDADVVVNSGTGSQTGLTGGYFRWNYKANPPAQYPSDITITGNQVSINETEMLSWGPRMVAHELSHFFFSLRDEYKGEVWEDYASWASGTAKIGDFRYNGTKTFDATRGITEQSLVKFKHPTTKNLYLMNVCQLYSSVDWVVDRVKGGCQTGEFTNPNDHPYPRSDLDYAGGSENDYFAFMTNTHVGYNTLSEWDVIKLVLESVNASASVTVPTSTTATMPSGYTAIDFSMLSGKNSVALVFDISGSMSGAKIKAVQDAATVYLDGLASRTFREDRLGVYVYNSAAQELYPLTTVTATNVAQVVKDLKDKVAALPSLVSGTTSIGAGLGKALEGLVSTAKTGYESIILFSDGLQNTAPAPDTKYQELKDRGVEVSSISFGSDASLTGMQEIAQATGGSYMHVDDATDLAVAFDGLRIKTMGYDNLIAVTDGLVASESKTYSVSVGAKDKDIQFSVFSGMASSLSLTLVDPLGGVHTVANPNGMKVVQSALQTALVIQTPIAGNWTVKVANPGTASARIRLNATAGSQLEGLKLDVAASPINPRMGDAVAITAFPYQKGILGGVVAVATVAAPDGSKQNVTLKDDGRGADREAEDGVYSGWYTGVGSVGAYEVTTSVEATAGVAYRIGDDGAREFLVDGFKRQGVANFAGGEGERSEQTLPLGSCRIDNGANWAGAVNGVPFTIEPNVGDYIYLTSDGPEYAIRVGQTSSTWWTGFATSTYKGKGGTGPCTIVRNKSDDNSSFQCTGACLQAIPMSGSAATLNTTGDAWYKVDRRLEGWQISEFEGRTIEVNGEVVTPGQVPLPQSVGGVYYFHFGSGTKSWASWSVW